MACQTLQKHVVRSSKFIRTLPLHMSCVHRSFEHAGIWQCLNVFASDSLAHACPPNKLSHVHFLALFFSRQLFNLIKTGGESQHGQANAHWATVLHQSLGHACKYLCPSSCDWNSLIWSFPLLHFRSSTFLCRLPLHFTLYGGKLLVGFSMLQPWQWSIHGRLHTGQPTKTWVERLLIGKLFRLAAGIACKHFWFSNFVPSGTLTATETYILSYNFGLQMFLCVLLSSHDSALNQSSCWMEKFLHRLRCTKPLKNAITWPYLSTGAELLPSTRCPLKILT